MFVKILGFDVRWMITLSDCISLEVLTTRRASITRIYYYKLYKELSSISFKNSQLFKTITINFIIDILFAINLYIEKINNAILVLINKLIKHATYIATIKELNIKSFAKLL